MTAGIILKLISAALRCLDYNRDGGLGPRCVCALLPPSSFLVAGNFHGEGRSGVLRDVIP
jgi:hypothetical protein